MELSSIRALTYPSLTLRIFLSILLGGIVGMERGMKNRPAGLRTYMLVCLGACIVMITNQYVNQTFGVGDPVRMGAQVISGIGFLGAGTIIVTARTQIKGLTTAAGLWASACVGLALGIGLYEVALLGSVSIFIILTLLHELDAKMRRKTRLVEVYVELKQNVSIGAFLSFARQNALETSNLQLQMDNTGSTENMAFSITLRGPKKCAHESIMQIIRTMDGLRYAEEL